MICVALITDSADRLRRDLELVAGKADLVEFRLDRMPGARPRDLLALSPLPAIFTCRRRSDGGGWQGPESERLALLQGAVDVGAAYVDVEVDAAPRLSRRKTTKTIISHHDFEETSDDLGAIYGKMAALHPDVVKVVTTARDVTDNLKLFALLRRATLPTIAFAMGERGLVSRVLTRKFGGYLTFASVARGAESAPGQLTLDELRGLYRYKSITSETAVYGVIGNPIGHSLSPHIHNAAFAELGIDAVYLPFLVDDVTAFVRAFDEVPVSGYSVTIPHKLAVMEAMDEIDPLARSIGAVNTVVRRAGRLLGSNTDCPAAVSALLNALQGTQGATSPLAGKRVFLLGAGGAARGVAFGLKQEGARVTILNRTVEKAETLARELGFQWGGLGDLGRAACDVLVNTTSVGMHPDVEQSLVPTEVLRPGLVVFDAVYNPIKTRLLAEAEEAGCVTVSGVDWFVERPPCSLRPGWSVRPPVSSCARSSSISAERPCWTGRSHSGEHRSHRLSLHGQDRRRSGVGRPAGPDLRRCRHLPPGALGQDYRPGLRGRRRAALSSDGTGGHRRAGRAGRPGAGRRWWGRPRRGKRSPTPRLGRRGPPDGLS